MALDRFVYWTDKRPTHAQLHFLLEDYFSGIATVQWRADQNRWYVTLPGQVRNALARQGGATIRSLAEEELANPRERWIEVVWTDHRVDVLTRSQDQVTSAMADGLHELVRRFWSGRS